ncbi:M48 family metallopeptidase [Microbulbifer thermotolerans]|uniref:M48 family metallopeptidase n=1 Tax=Microbulbifer thermotolerans TaxID=252514 RepID=A0AB35HUX2_MICTH|nr:M48 family metallopeptidase [Microbulbifer thermotolerans]MCX2780765.1 M48 family metallopeptidase [Microbulbifer thermotolerans]MCX2783081.1 M48 family metallopeptidase [Microbulbifer thermotolerans]MCX2794317.1 M48 family metallopeptidase [Microbulbifer thermotolerans]MCX2800661.1 M48 family metallopeptidase [Microbulbifer thermotolerans]MCX2806504.1 M48 family metallopeptidase [Microbulbifer thermotolerans]
MNFFEYQDRAKRNTGLLVGLFTLAVLLLIGITTLLAAALVAYSQGLDFSPAQIGQLLGWDTVVTIALSIAAVIGLGSLYKLRQLAAGGRAVAESLGGRKINIAPHGDAEKRALNVVEEMAIASGTPVPDVYLIEDDAINAFAAGYKPSDAVIGLTRGCIEKLNRDELAGVVAHEFSHIFNGDMRLNIRIVGLLHGILIIGMLGYWLLRGSHFSSSRDNRGRTALFGIGAGLMVIGYTGTFFGNLIKSAVSRQREFLADASAVQYTRNNRGIAGALKKIGGYSAGSELASSNAAEFSHMYFASGLKKSFANLFATHPPLAERIARLDPQWNGHFPNVDKEPLGFSVTEQQNAQVMGIAPVASASSSASLQQVIDAVDNSICSPSDQQVVYGRQLLQAVPEAVKQAAHDPFAARALVYHLMMHGDQQHRKQQHQLLQKIAHPAVMRELQRLGPQLRDLAAGTRLVLLDLCVPALKALAPQQYQVFKRNLIKLLRSDGVVELWEWALYRVLMHALEGSPDRQRLSPKGGAEKDAARFILAAVAHAGNPDYLSAKRAYETGLNAMQLNITPLPTSADITLPRLDKAVAIAALMPPLKKPVLLKAIATTMVHDGIVAAEEIELLRAVADSLDCPMPPIAPTTATTAAAGTTAVTERT